VRLESRPPRCRWRRRATARPAGARAGPRAPRGPAPAVRRRGGSPRRPRGLRRSAAGPAADVVRARLVDAVAVAVLVEEVGHRVRKLLPPLRLERRGERPRRPVGIEERLPHPRTRLPRLRVVALDEVEVEGVAEELAHALLAAPVERAADARRRRRLEG